MRMFANYSCTCGIPTIQKAIDMKPINIRDYEALARSCLDPSTWDYYQGGSDDELTLSANCSGYDRFRLRPRVLVDVSTCDLATTALGIPISMPIGIAPLGCQC